MANHMMETYRSVISQRLTKFEIARVIGARALQLAMGAPPLIDVSNIEIKDPVYIAILELLKRLLPMSIIRPGKDDTRELVSVNKLITPEIERYLSSILKSWDISRRV